MNKYFLIFILASVGVSEMSYLIRKRIAAQKPMCPMHTDCEVVLTSKWSHMFIVPNDVLGILNFIAVLVLVAFLVIGIGPLYLWALILKIFIAIASLSSVFFIFLQWKVIKAWCFWCIMSACTFWLIAVLLFLGHF